MWMDTSVTESEGAAKLRPPQGAGLRGEEKKSIMRKKQFERKKKTNEKKHEETEETRQERGVGGTGIVGTFLQRACTPEGVVSKPCPDKQCRSEHPKSLPAPEAAHKEGEGPARSPAVAPQQLPQQKRV